MFEDPYISVAISCGVMSYMLLIWSSLPKKGSTYCKGDNYYNEYQNEECSWRKLFGRNQSKLGDEENPFVKMDGEINDNCETVIEMDPELYNEIWWG